MICYITICTTAIFAFATYNLLKKLELIEDELLDTIDEILDVRYKVNTAIKEMRIIDSKEAFEKDDDVGTVFAALNDIVKELGEETNEG